MDLKNPLAVTPDIFFTFDILFIHCFIYNFDLYKVRVKDQVVLENITANNFLHCGTRRFTDDYTENGHYGVCLPDENVQTLLMTPLCLFSYSV